MSKEAYESVIGAMLSAIAEALRDEANAESEDRPIPRLGDVADRLEALDTAPIAAELAAAVASSAPSAAPPSGDPAAYESDGRAAPWRVRLRLFDTFDELRADTDPEAAVDAPGSDTVTGLPAVATWAGAIAASYHGHQGLGIAWPGDKDIRHRLKSLRPTLSRAGGSAIWRIPYTVDGDGDWKAVINVSRAEEPSE